MRVVVVGAGGREHALVRALRRSPSAPEVLCAPGNAGILRDAAAFGASPDDPGAFAEAAKAQEARHKLEKAGLKTYTHVAETKDGKRTRVRVGPFATRAEADRAGEKVRKLGLAAAVLTL